MKIEIPEWIKKSGKYVLTGVGAVVGLLWVQSGQSPEELDKYTQMYFTSDSVMVVKKSDTTWGAITESDKYVKLQNWTSGIYSDGFTQYVIEIKTINLITGDVYPQSIVSIVPEIGTNVVVDAAFGSAELATEKIPEQLDRLPLVKAEELGWFAVIDTVVTKDDKGAEVKREPVKQWTTDAAQKPVGKDVSVDAGTVVDPIETIPEETR